MCAEDRPVAWDDPLAVRRWRRLRRTGRIWLLVSLALFFGVSYFLGRQDDHRDWLVQHGAHTVGIVLEDPAETLRCQQVGVPVRFSTGSREVVATFFVDSCDGRDLHRGDHVHVNFDTHNPSDMVVNGQTNEQPLATLLSLIAIVLAGFFFGGWVLRARTLHRSRCVLQRGQWMTRTIAVQPFRSRTTRGRRLVRFVDGQDDAMLVTSFLGRNATPVSGAVDVAGDPQRACVLRDARSDMFVLARRFGSGWTRRRIHKQTP